MIDRRDRSYLEMAASSLAVAVAFGLVTLASRYRSLYARIMGLRWRDPATFASIEESLKAIEETYSKYKPDEIALAFNGGKDCLIVFQLVKGFCQHRCKPMPQLVYFEREDEFSEMIDFMNETVASNGLSIHMIRGGFKQGLEELKNKGVKAVFMGQRRSDPYAPQTIFAETTEGWPEMMRVNPILNLSYAGVWAFLRGTATKYCSLYDQGYTSLGPKSKTKPNSKLNNNSLSSPRPAHELVVQQDDDERAGRASHSQAVS